ncbi:hypothetical protein E1B28_006842 [Marasmius oreades]|uniref:Uncharacterized protein n=1 Tax=Marasmius oreades TaxID=181124 RepID=A0A9P7UWZ2_9AGAR|nr:uncharacterized protein E1B28_006842 [Marasmius oreades]KAG7096169.1 hypothetical protein E1B28_006842 [Marasmius oreades]
MSSGPDMLKRKIRMFEVCVVKAESEANSTHRWEPGSLLTNCSWMLGKFWRDVGMDNLGRPAELLGGIEVVSSNSFRGNVSFLPLAQSNALTYILLALEECKARLDQGQGLHTISEPEQVPLYTETITLDGLGAQHSFNYLIQLTN